MPGTNLLWPLKAVSSQHSLRIGVHLPAGNGGFKSVLVTAPLLYVNLPRLQSSTCCIFIYCIHQQQDERDAMRTSEYLRSRSVHFRLAPIQLATVKIVKARQLQ